MKEKKTPCDSRFYHLVVNGLTMPEIVCDRFIYDAHNGVWIHQFRFKLGDKDWGVSKELPAELVAEAMDQQKWIPVTERLPEVVDTYLVVVKYKYDYEVEYDIDVDVATYNPYEKAYIDDCWNTYNDWNEGQQYLHVTHWMPLPQPPKGEQQCE